MPISSGEFLFQIVEDGEAVEIRTRIASMPAANHEALLRFALSLNDGATGEGRLSLKNDTLEFSRQELIRGLDPKAALRRWTEFQDSRAKLKRLFAEGYGAPDPLSFGQDRLK